MNMRSMTSKWSKGTKIALAGALLGSLMQFSATAGAADTEQRLESRNECDTPVGTWLYTVTIPDPSGGASLVFQGTETYGADGTYTEADELGVSPNYLATPGHGVWKPNGARKFLLTYHNFTYDAAGSNGTGKVRQTTRLSENGNSYTGSGDFFYYDLNGAVVLNGTFTITAKRIQIEKPQ